MEKLEIKKSKWFLINTVLIGLIFMPLLLVGIPIIIWGVLRYKLDKIEIADGQFYSRMGVLNIDTKTIPLNKISMVSLKQDIVSKMCNYGVIQIQSSAINSTIEYPCIDDAENIVREINRRL